jgi:UDP-N-acetylglucosamine--N-acetylmuramyl-(pentapeptide) pyrophosphoryl-undecaprenol N-acetylglucosamine transferase
MSAHAPMATTAPAGPVLIMAGGTGGHIFPGLAVARALQARAVPVLWLGSALGLENRLVPEAGIALETIAIAGLRGKGIATLLAAPPRLLRAIWQARRVMRRHRPRSVLSLGGFAAAPGGIAAWLLGRPLLVHEQNRIPGLTNRLLARFARRVMAGFPDAFRGAEAVGNPVRAEIAALPSPASRLAGRSGPLRLLVLGGSQGARALNRGLPPVIAGLPAGAVEVRHQCGARMLEETRAAYRAAGVDVEPEPFIADMAAAYGWADLVVCRAGALTIAELAAAGIGALLVPFPAAVDDHQSANARWLVEAGGGELVPEGEGFEARLQAALARLVDDRARLLAMAAAARALARLDAAERVADACLEEARP